MRCHVRSPLAALVVLVLFPILAGAAPLGTAFTYQGSLDKSGLPGGASCVFTFKLFDAVSAGNQIGVTLTPGVTLLENGQFSTTLDFGPGAFDGNARWLEITVQCPNDGSPTLLAPRQAITPAPYALYTLSGAGGGGLSLPFFGPVTSATQDAFKVQNNASTGAFFALHGASATTTTNAGGVFGEATGASGQVVGVFGKATTSPTGIGVIGQGSVNGAFFEALNTTGDGTAVWGQAHTNANNAAGVKGSNASTTGSTVGVWGIATASAFGTGVAGQGGAVGGYFSTSSTNSGGDFAGVYGIAAVHPGVKGVSANAAGVRGEGSVGVQGVANSSFAIGVAGSGNSLLPAVSGQNQGSGDGVAGTSSGGNAVSGLAFSTGGYGGYFKNSAVGGVALYADGPASIRTLSILGGADIAERFEVDGNPEPGSVMVIDERAPGRLRVSDRPYSPRVAGVVSGANALPAGMVLGESVTPHSRSAIALTGRVWVRCDASAAPIRSGDLLTSADRPGYAMKAVDRDRAYGAILGKAMTALEHGTGYVLVLVSLQ